MFSEKKIPTAHCLLCIADFAKKEICSLMFARELTDFGKWCIIPKTQFSKRNSRWNITFYLRIFRPKCLAWPLLLRWALALMHTASLATTLWWKSPPCCLSPLAARPRASRRAAEKWTRTIRIRTTRTWAAGGRGAHRRTDRSFAIRALP